MILYQEIISVIAALYSSSMAQYCQKSVCGHYIGVWGKLSLVPTVTDQAGCALARAWGGGGEERAVN